MFNKKVKSDYKKSGVRVFCAIMASAALMSTSIPAFAKSNEEIAVCCQDTTEVVEEASVVEETESVEEAPVAEETEVVEEASAAEEVEVVEEISAAEEAEVVEEASAAESVEDASVAEETEEALAAEEETYEKTEDVSEETKHSDDRKMIEIVSRNEINQYDITPGKTYYLIESGVIGKSRINRVTANRVFEDPKWYGSERMVEVTNPDNGKTWLVQANKFFGSSNFYEVSSVYEDEREIWEKQGQTTKLCIPDTIPHFGEVKRCYYEYGAQVAFTFFIYYCPSPIGYEVIEYIEDQIKDDNLGYTIDGVHYASPKDDPYFKDKSISYV